MSLSRHGWLLSIGILAISSACESVAGLRYARKELVTLQVAPFPLALSDSGVLLIAGELADVLELGSKDRIPVALTTSAGDRETVGMWHTWCAVGTPFREFNCFTMTVVVLPDADREMILTRIRGMSLVPTGAADGSLAWTVVGFDPMAIANQARTISRWHGVEDVIVGGLHYAADPAKSVAAPIRVSRSVPRPDDGVLQLSPGDTLSASYVNPSGDTLRASLVVPPL